MQKILFTILNKRVSSLRFSSLLYSSLFLILFTFPTLAQDVRLAATYNRNDFPTFNKNLEVENVNGFTLEADAKLINFSEYGRISAAYNYRRKLNQEVFPQYFDGMKLVDLYRDVDTHSVGIQAGYTLGEIIEPFAGLFYGSRKIHENAPFQLVRYVRLGVNIIPKKSPLFLKAYLDYEQPYGILPTGFVNPYNRTLGIGLGFRFNRSSNASKLLP